MKDPIRISGNTVRLWAEDKNHESIKFFAGSRKSTADYTWFRGEHCNYAPTVSGIHNLSGIENFILKGWEPASPFITRNTKITAFGSCFAANISKYLAARNFNILTDGNKDKENANSYVVRFGEGMVNTYAILQQFEWAFYNKTPSGDLWHGYDATSFGYDESIRIETLKIFDKTDVFIITLGLSEVWFDEVTGDVFWRAVPKDKYDPSRHKFRVVSTEQNRENITSIINIIKRNKPESKIIFTLSPIPLTATFRAVSCITANSVSKANLRSALDESIRNTEYPDDVFYWPSYEIVTEGFLDKFLPDRRHIKPSILDYIMGLFEKYYCVKDDSNDDSIYATLLRRYVQARIDDGTYPGRVATALSDDTEKLRNIIRAGLKKGNVEYVEPLVRLACLTWPDDRMFAQQLKTVEERLASGRGLPREKANTGKKQRKSKNQGGTR